MKNPRRNIGRGFGFESNFQLAGQSPPDVGIVMTSIIDTRSAPQRSKNAACTSAESFFIRLACILSITCAQKPPIILSEDHFRSYI